MLIVVLKISVALVSFLGVWLLSRNPHWTLSRWLLSWRGPAPYSGETYSHFSFRWALYSAKYALLIGSAVAIAMYFDLGDYGVGPIWLTALFIFVLPMLTLMAMVSFLGFLFKAGWSLIFHRSSSYSELTNEFEVDA
jgi:hypothetical protein